MQNHLKQVAVVGRSNVGKSSFINAFTNQKIAVTSKTPGRTQSLICYDLGFKQPFHVNIVDFPGYGFAKAPGKEVEKWKKLTTAYFDHSSTLDTTVVLVDSRRGLGDLDKMLFEMLEDMQKKYVMVLTKADRINSTQLKETILSCGKELKDFKFLLPFVFATSAK